MWNCSPMCQAGSVLDPHGWPLPRIRLVFESFCCYSLFQTMKTIDMVKKDLSEFSEVMSTEVNDLTTAAKGG